MDDISEKLLWTLHKKKNKNYIYIYIYALHHVTLNWKVASDENTPSPQAMCVCFLSRSALQQPECCCFLMCEHICSHLIWQGSGAGTAALFLTEKTELCICLPHLQSAINHKLLHALCKMHKCSHKPCCSSTDGFFPLCTHIFLTQTYCMCFNSICCRVFPC